MNKVILVGRIVKDPVVNENGGTKTAKFSIAVQRDYKNKDGKYEADFPNCTAFGKTADLISTYFHKGSQIGIDGRISTGSYTNKEGNKVYTTEVLVKSVEFIGSKAENDSAQAKKEESPKSEAADGFMNVPDSIDDVPFG